VGRQVGDHGEAPMTELAQVPAGDITGLLIVDGDDRQRVRRVDLPDAQGDRHTVLVRLA
jgi:hypothetical protein